MKSILMSIQPIWQNGVKIYTETEIADKAKEKKE